jgi:hypothetical protein
MTDEKQDKRGADATRNFWAKMQSARVSSFKVFVTSTDFSILSIQRLPSNGEIETSLGVQT